MKAINRRVADLKVRELHLRGLDLIIHLNCYHYFNEEGCYGLQSFAVLLSGTMKKMNLCSSKLLDLSSDANLYQLSKAKANLEQ